MSIERRCNKCGYVEDIRFNFGDNYKAEVEFHAAFKCPKGCYLPEDRYNDSKLDMSYGSDEENV